MPCLVRILLVKLFVTYNIGVFVKYSSHLNLALSNMLVALEMQQPAELPGIEGVRGSGYEDTSEVLTDFLKLGLLDVYKNQKTEESNLPRCQALPQEARHSLYLAS